MEIKELLSIKKEEEESSRKRVGFEIKEFRFKYPISDIKGQNEIKQKTGAGVIKMCGDVGGGHTVKK